MNEELIFLLNFSALNYVLTGRILAEIFLVSKIKRLCFPQFSLVWNLKTHKAFHNNKIEL